MSGDNLCCQHLQNWEKTEGKIWPWAQLVVWGNDDSVCVFDWGGALFKMVPSNPFSIGTETSLVNKLERMWGNHSQGEVQAWKSPMRSVPTKAAVKICIRLLALWLWKDINPYNTAPKTPALLVWWLCAEDRGKGVPREGLDRLDGQPLASLQHGYPGHHLQTSEIPLETFYSPLKCPIQSKVPSYHYK